MNSTHYGVFFSMLTVILAHISFLSSPSVQTGLSAPFAMHDIVRIAQSHSHSFEAVSG